MATEEQRSVYEGHENKAGDHVETVHEAAVVGIAATDQHGHSVVALDTAAEKKLRHKIDWFILPSVAIVYLCCFLDRVNIGNARLAGFEADLDMHGWDFNTALCMFYVSYIVFEFPCMLLCKYVGPGWFLPAAVVGFGLFTLAMAFVETKGAAYAVRFMLGLTEAGMLPGIAYYLSRWYRSYELTFRISLYMVMGPLSGAFGGLLASGILSLDHFGSLHHWRMIFAIEGMITMILGVISFFTITDRPETARWLTAEQKDLAISRLKSERLATTELVDKWNRKKIRRGICSPVQLANALVYTCCGISVQGISVFMPTIVRTIYPRSSVIHQQLRTVPPYVVGVFTVLLLPYISGKIRRRQIFFSLCMPFAITGYAMFVGTTTAQATVRYGAFFLITAGAMPMGAFGNAQAAANAVSDSSRNAGIALTNFAGNLGGLIATWTYLPTDAPDYRIGNGINVGTTTLIFVVGTATLIFMNWDNKRRDARDVEAELAGLSQAEIQDLEWKHPGFRWSV